MYPPLAEELNFAFLILQGNIYFTIRSKSKQKKWKENFFFFKKKEELNASLWALVLWRWDTKAAAITCPHNPHSHDSHLSSSFHFSKFFLKFFFILLQLLLLLQKAVFRRPHCKSLSLIRGGSIVAIKSNHTLLFQLSSSPLLPACEIQHDLGE